MIHFRNLILNIKGMILSQKKIFILIYKMRIKNKNNLGLIKILKTDISIILKIFICQQLIKILENFMKMCLKLKL
jgi:hypothetical protein